MILMGHNGTGKTTFIYYLIGFYTSINQHPFLKNFQEFTPLKKGSFGFSPEVTLLDSNLLIKDYISLYSDLRGVEFQKDILELVDLDISLKTKIGNLSKGMKQRVSLALALIGNPKYLVLDEPTSGLDIQGEKIIINLLKNRQKDFKFIISTHSTKLATALNDEVFIFSKGKIISKFFPKNEQELWNIL